MMSKYLFRFILVLLPLAFLSLKPDTSSFEIIGDTSMAVVLTIDQKLELAEMKIKNLTDKPVVLRWTRVKNTLKDDWDYSMCAFGKCQIGIPSGGILKKIAPGKTGFIAIHLFPKGVKGKGKVSFKLQDTANPQFQEEVEFLVEVQ